MDACILNFPTSTRPLSLNRFSGTEHLSFKVKQVKERWGIGDFNVLI